MGPSTYNGKAQTLRFGDNEFCWGKRTYIMGVLNVTPDSFSGDGLLGKLDLIVEKALVYVEQGADIIDVGGESTRPQSVYGHKIFVTEKEELERVIPVIEALRKHTAVPISIDTNKPNVAAAALEAGASIINDVSPGLHESKLYESISLGDSAMVLMHNYDRSKSSDVVADIIEDFQPMVEMALRSGVSEKHIILDPGSGFGKTLNQNLEILRRLDEFSILGMPLLLGMSRKSSIGRVLKLPVEERLEGTAATVAIAISRGVDIVRVHDVLQMKRVAVMTDAILRCPYFDEAQYD